MNRPMVETVYVIKNLYVFIQIIFLHSLSETEKKNKVNFSFLLFFFLIKAPQVYSWVEGVKMSGLIWSKQQH